MLGKLAGWDDTIVALATPPGVGAIGVIRLSGPQSVAIVDKLFVSKDLEMQASHTLHVGFLKDGEEVLDEVVVSLYRAPRSYTGEDVVEVSCHGSPYVQERVIQAFLGRGARIAKPGEFTQRAFLHGKFDLTQAEAVADLIASNTAASARTALHTIRGGFSRALKELRVQLLSFSALIELELDFSQEDVEFADRAQFYALIREAEDTTAALLQSFRLGNVIRNGVQVAIVGKPNAGKSTLLNTLLNENRAIVSEIAGTTRDTIEEILNIDGILFRLIDTAGIRRHSTDLIENMGMEKSREKIEQADIVLYLFDVADTVEEVEARRREMGGGRVAGGEGVAGLGGEGPRGDRAATASGGAMLGGGVKNEGQVETEANAFGGDGSASGGVAAPEGEGVSATGERTEWPNANSVEPAGGSQLDGGRVSSVGNGSQPGRSKNILWVANKVDVFGGGGGLEEGDVYHSENAAREKFRSISDAVFISARQDHHIGMLKQRLVDMVLDGKTNAEGTIVTNTRHFHALQQVAQSLEEIHKGLDSGLTGDLLSLDIRRCLHWLGEITGEITSEDQLDYIFSKFCIGK